MSVERALCAVLIGLAWGSAPVSAQSSETQSSETQSSETQSPAVVQVGALSEGLHEELTWLLGPLGRASTAAEAFASGARAMVRQDVGIVVVVRRDGTAHAFPHRADGTRDRRVATDAAQWLMTPTPTSGPPPEVRGPGYGSYAQRRPMRPRTDWRGLRQAHRSEQPWRFRIGIFLSATPRSDTGLGPYEDDPLLYDYLGFGARFTLTRFLHPSVRLDMSLTLGRVRGSWEVEDHGFEGGLGAQLIVNSRSRTRFGGGVGVEAVLAREYELANDGHFAWLGARLSLVGEVAWTGRNRRGLVLQVMPTFTHVPYAGGFHPGLMFTAGVEFGAGGNPSNPTEHLIDPAAGR